MCSDLRSGWIKGKLNDIIRLSNSQFRVRHNIQIKKCLSCINCPYCPPETETNKSTEKSRGSHRKPPQIFRSSSKYALIEIFIYFMCKVALLTGFRNPLDLYGLLWSLQVSILITLGVSTKVIRFQNSSASTTRIIFSTVPQKDPKVIQPIFRI